MFFAVLVLVFLVPLASNATPVETQLWFEPEVQTYSYGDMITVDLYADILEVDAILGFGFDLSFDGGSTFVTEGDADSYTGDYLTFTGFEANSLLFVFDTFFPPLWEDGDTISGEVPFGDADVWGNSILLGTFSFQATTTGPLGVETLYLGAPDINDPYRADGLISGDMMAPISFMPNNPTATAAPVPEPATLLLFGSGLAALAVRRRKIGRTTE